MTNYDQRSKQIDTWLSKEDTPLRERLYLLSLPGASSETLSKFASRRGIGALFEISKVAKNPSTSAQSLEAILQRKIPRLLFSTAIFSNPNFPYEKIKAKSRREKIALARNPNLPISLYEPLMQELNAKSGRHKRLYLPKITKKIVPIGSYISNGGVSLYDHFFYVAKFSAFDIDRHGEKALMDLFKSSFVTLDSVESMEAWGNIDISGFAIDQRMLRRKYRRLANYYKNKN